ncbi:MAG TPA: PLP-dependent transferase, partial [Paenalcaligenes sp.]|nr:PLP-dependent transferase [Paenalcaligenes sp.]
SALQLCEQLALWPEVQRIFHPAWPEDPGHALWQRDAQGSNGMLSIACDWTPAQTRAFVDGLQYFGIGFSWGGFESLVQWVDTPALTPHSYWPWGGSMQLLRLQVGLESPQTLIEDLQQARARALQA